MTSLADLRRAYDQVLKGSYPASSAEKANDAFEVYVLSLVLQAAKSEGASIYFESMAGINNPAYLVFRTSPGNIYSKAKDYTHALIKFSSDLVYEAHIGIYISGTSGVLHECDVSVLKSDEGNFCRRNRVHPKKANTILTAECKFYSGNLGIALGREFLGATMDLGKDNRFFVSNSQGDNLDKILAHHGRKHYLGLRPSLSDTEEQMIALFREVFRYCKAKAK